MADVFLSYSQADRNRAKQIADALSAKGWSVWWDVSLVAGVHFRSKIAEELQAARCVAVLWSKASLKSDFVVDEAEDGKRRGVLVQVLIEDVRPPHGFRQIQAALLMGWDGGDSGEFERLCTGISQYAPVAAKQTVVFETDGASAIPVNVNVVTSGSGVTSQPSSTHVRQLSAVEVVTPVSVPARIAWKPVKTGLAIEVTNDQPHTMKGVQLMLKDLRWWNKKIKQFVESKDALGFQGFPLSGTRRLSSGAAAEFSCIHCSPGGGVRIAGAPPGLFDDPPTLWLGQTGGWRVNLLLTWHAGTFEQALEFFWDGEHAPAAFDSGSSSDTLPEQWRNLEQRFNDLDTANLKVALWMRVDTGQFEWKVHHAGAAKAERDFIALAELAGKLLRGSPLVWAEVGAKVSSTNVFDRWCFFLKWTGAVSETTTAVDQMGKGIEITEIDNAAKASARACRVCSDYESVL
jgi:hypothetical protein